MPVDTDEHEAVQRFQSLSLSIPLDPSQFDYIKQFIQRLLNVEDVDRISNPEPITTTYHDKSHEILPDICFPNDIWLRDNITIRDIKLKVTMLNEVVAMLKNECLRFNEPVDDTTLLYYQKVLVAYKLYDTPTKPHYSSDLANDFSVKEEVEEDNEEYQIDEGRSLNRTHSNGSSVASLRTHMSFFSHSSTNLNGNSSSNSNGNAINFNTLNGNQPSNISSKRGSTGSKENGMTRKRFLSFIGNNHQSNGNASTAQPTTMAYVIDPNAPVEEVSEEEQKKQQALNGILSKSRIYNKIKKNRELSSSVNSNVSIPSLAYSSRNSVSTTATASSNVSKSRRSSNITSPDNSELKHASFNPIPIFATYSLTQRQENQKQKYEYYNQVTQLLKIIEQILHHLRLDHKDAKAFKLMDFIKRFIFKFIVFDASEMVVTYGEIEAYRLYNRLTN